MIAGHVQVEPMGAIRIFCQMQQEGYITPDKATLYCVLKACSMIAFLEKGREIHSCVIDIGYVVDTEIGKALIVMYGKCGCLQDAQLVFDRLITPGIKPWGSLIAAYAEHGSGQQAFCIFEEMQKVGVKADPATFVCVLNLCFNPTLLEQGMSVHAYVVQCGLDQDVFISNALIDMYAKCGSFQNACIHFKRVLHPDVVTYNTVITACGQHNWPHEAHQLFELMLQQGVKPDDITFVCTLKACSFTLSLEQGYYIHSHAIRNGVHVDDHVSSALMDMFIKCGNLENARKIFERLPKRGVMVWSVLIGAYIHHVDSRYLIHLLEKLEEEGLKPDEVIFVLVLKACSMLAALEHGCKVHASVIENGFERNNFVSSTIVDMYMNCGSLDNALVVFDQIPNRTVVTWNVLLSGFIQHGQFGTALQKFDDMQEAGIKPDEVSILCYLSACSRAGFVGYGCGLFKSMLGDFGIEPALKHFNCVADMLGQAGYLPETEDLLETIPFGPNVVGWTSLLTSCKMHANVNVGRRCFNNIATMDCADAMGYVLMSGIYAQAGMWDGVRRLDELRRCLNRWKKPARAYIEVDNMLHSFSVNETQHPRSADIHAKINTLSGQLEKDKQSKESEKSKTQKDDALCGHCERLAIAFGLLSTSLGTTIRVAKNIRMCVDCHSLTKKITIFENREIVVKDAYCIHHFQDGACSCGD